MKKRKTTVNFNNGRTQIGDRAGLSLIFGYITNIYNYKYKYIVSLLTLFFATVSELKQRQQWQKD